MPELVQGNAKQTRDRYGTLGMRVVQSRMTMLDRHAGGAGTGKSDEYLQAEYCAHAHSIKGNTSVAPENLLSVTHSLTAAMHSFSRSSDMDSCTINQNIKGSEGTGFLQVRT